MTDVKPVKWSRLRYWAYCWYKTLTLPRHIKHALKQPINPDDFVEVQRPMPEVRHVQVETPNWDTKVRCSCGADFVSRCEFWKHGYDAMLPQLIEYQSYFGRTAEEGLDHLSQIGRARKSLYHAAKAVVDAWEHGGSPTAVIEPMEKLREVVDKQDG